MFSPDMMQAAQKMMANMKPEDMQRMSQMAANMDPKVMENMMKSMGGGNTHVDTAQAMDQMKNMTPEQLQTGFTQAQSQMSAQQRYMFNAAEMLKNEGNTHVKNEQYVEALKKYTKALENITGHTGNDASALQLSLLNNAALCYLKTKEFEKALKASEDALKVDPRSFKALFRRGQAHEALGNLRDAVADLRGAAGLSPSDKAISRELERLRGELRHRGLHLEEELGAPAGEAPTHEVSPAWLPSASTPSTSSGSRETSRGDRAGASGVDHWAKAAEKIAENPDMLKQATEAMSKFSPDQLQSMMGNTPLPPGMDPETMKSQMEHLQKNPEILRTAMETLKAIPQEERKKILTQRYGAMGEHTDPAGLNKLFDNPEMIQQAVEMTKGMSEDDLKKMNINSPEEADMMRKAAEQMASNPDLTKQISEMMKNMPPEQLQSMMDLSARMRGGTAGGMPSSAGMDPSSFMSDPDMMKATEEMMKGMPPETLASMARASGLDISDDKAKIIARFLPWMMKLMRWFGYLKRGWSAMCSPTGRVVLAVIVLMFAVLQHFRA